MDMVVNGVPIVEMHPLDDSSLEPEQLSCAPYCDDGGGAQSVLLMLLLLVVLRWSCVLCGSSSATMSKRAVVIVVVVWHAVAGVRITAAVRGRVVASGVVSCHPLKQKNCMSSMVCPSFLHKCETGLKERATLACR